MHPVKQANYAFWRINKFHCKNQDCNINDEIYLSHCLNGNCDNIIDSRISMKCNYSNQNPPPYVNEGLYICNKCSACCNRDTLERILSKPIHNDDFKKNLKWRIENNATHEERGERFCYKCGNILINSNQEYRRILNWLIVNQKSNKKILSSGKRAIDNKYWFRLHANSEKFSSLEKYGFNVIRDENNPDYALISERFNELLINLWHCSCILYATFILMVDSFQIINLMLFV